MHIILTILGLLAWIFGFLAFFTATGLPQQILAVEFGIAGAVMIAGAGVIGVLIQLRESFDRANPQRSKQEPAEEIHA